MPNFKKTLKRQLGRGWLHNNSAVLKSTYNVFLGSALVEPGLDFGKKFETDGSLFPWEITNTGDLKYQRHDVVL